MEREISDCSHHKGTWKQVFLDTLRRLRDGLLHEMNLRGSWMSLQGASGCTALEGSRVLINLVPFLLPSCPMAPAHPEALWCLLPTEKVPSALREGSLRFTAVTSGCLSLQTPTGISTVLLCSLSLFLSLCLSLSPGMCALQHFNLWLPRRESREEISKVGKNTHLRSKMTNVEQKLQRVKPGRCFPCKPPSLSLETACGFTLLCSRILQGARLLIQMLLPLTLILYVDSLKSVTNPRHRRKRRKKIRAGSLSFDQRRLMRTLVDKSGFQKVLSTVLCLRVDRFWHHGHQVNTFSAPLWLPYFPLFFINLFFCRRKWHPDNLSVKTNLLLDKESQWPSYNHIFYFTVHFNVEMVKEKMSGFC